MKKILSLVMSLVVVGFVFLVPFDVASAAPVTEITSGINATGTQGGRTATQILEIAVNVLFFILGALAVIMIIWSGIRYVTSAGNAAAITSAKNTLVYAVVGLIVALLAYAIVNFVLSSLTVPTTPAPTPTP